jgi:hypothetical protein
MWRTITSPEDGMPKFLSGSGKRIPFAVICRERLIDLAHTMPDAQSAVLLCLVWQAALQERLNRGTHAGAPVARLSGSELVEMTGCPLRTVRYALRKLRQASVIYHEEEAPGKKAVYGLNLTQPQRAKRASDSL